MMQWLSTIEGTGLAVWVRESNSIWAYPTVLTLHTLGLGVLVGANWALDLRLLGVGERIPLAPLRQLFPIMWFGFWINAITGVMLFAADATSKGATGLFVFKLVLVALAVVAIQLTKSRVYGSGADAGAITGATRGLAVASLVLWTAAIAAGRYMAYA